MIYKIAKKRVARSTLLEGIGPLAVGESLVVIRVEGAESGLDALTALAPLLHNAQLNPLH